MKVMHGDCSGESTGNGLLRDFRSTQILSEACLEKHASAYGVRKLEEKRVFGLWLDLKMAVQIRGEQRRPL